MISQKRHSVHLLTLQHITKVYESPAGPYRAVDDVSLTFAPGEFAAVIGPSGSGKSTLLNLIAGLDQPSRGRIFLGDIAVHALDENELARWRGRNVGVVFQFFQLLPTLTVLDNVLLPMDFAGTFDERSSRRHAMGLLEQLGVAAHATKLPAALSGGEQQRVAIARAIVNDPSLVVADEPTGNLDSQSTDVIIALLRSLADAGKTVVMVTHDPKPIEAADRVVSLVDGRLPLAPVTQPPVTQPPVTQPPVTQPSELAQVRHA